jgi:hypothetical protein
MTPHEHAQAMADAQGRPWWLWSDPQGRNRLASDLADVAGYVQLQKFIPAGRFRQLPFQQSIATR